MAQRLNITAVRKQLLSLPQTMVPGEFLDVIRHRRTVLRIVRTDDVGALGMKNPFTILDEALAYVSRPKKQPPRFLARDYKRYLYGKKK